MQCTCCCSEKESQLVCENCGGRISVSPRSPGCSIALPVITDEMWDMFSETSLMTFDRENGKPHWTQDAVDLACVLKCECNGN